MSIGSPEAAVQIAEPPRKPRRRTQIAAPGPVEVHPAPEKRSVRSSLDSALAVSCGEGALQTDVVELGSFIVIDPLDALTVPKTASQNSGRTSQNSGSGDVW